MVSVPSTVASVAGGRWVRFRIRPEETHQSDVNEGHCVPLPPGARGIKKHEGVEAVHDECAKKQPEEQEGSS